MLKENKQERVGTILSWTMNSRWFNMLVTLREEGMSYKDKFQMAHWLALDAAPLKYTFMIYWSGVGQLNRVLLNNLGIKCFNIGIRA